MTKYFERIIDITTGEETIRPYTQEEIAIVEAEQAKLEAELAKLATEQAAKDSARQVVLDKLGLSADDIAALFG